MMSHTTFQIIYDGPALENSTMDVKDLAPALLALGEANNENVISENEIQRHIFFGLKILGRMFWSSVLW